MTISNDAGSNNNVPMIESSERVNTSVSSGGTAVESLYPTTLGQQKIGVEINKSACSDSSCRVVKFKTDVDVLYKLKYKGSEYDAIGCWTTSTGHKWVHSQIGLNYDDFDAINKLVKYAIYGY